MDDKSRREKMKKMHLVRKKEAVHKGSAPPFHSFPHHYFIVMADTLYLIQNK